MNSRRTLLAALALLTVLAGCVGAGLDGPPREAPASESGTATGASTYEVAVVSVVDGDTIDVAYPNGTTERVRLLGVDTPEVSAENDPAEFEGVPETEAGRDCLRAAGEGASAAVRQRVADREVTLVVDPAADRRGDFGRLLAYVRVNGTDLNRWLLAEGHARVYDSTFSRSADYYATEREAREAGRGLWTCRSPSSGADRTTESRLAVARVHPDAEGNDNGNLNDEFVVFENAAESTLVLDGWTASDEVGHVYEFPDGFALGPGELVTLHTGTGTDTPTDLYWGRSGAVWNNDGDTVFVRDANGTVVDRREY
ncbi:MAG: lamin tail domain-containing protein [Haloarculaceae archaeon]